MFVIALNMASLSKYLAVKGDSKMMNEIDLSHAMGVFDQIEQTLSDVKKHMLADNHQKQTAEENHLLDLCKKFTATIRAGKK